MTLLNEINAYNNELDKIHTNFNDLKLFNEIKVRIWEIVTESSEIEVNLISRKSSEEIKVTLRNNNYI